jgi:putative ABC transport system permease protein
VDRIGATGDVVVLDADGWRANAGAGMVRWFQPFTFTGYLVVIAAGVAVANMLVLGLVQMRRQRATLGALGQPVAGQRRTLAWQAAIVAGLAVVFGLGWSQFFTMLLSLSSPVYYGVHLTWRPASGPMVVGALVSLLLAVVASVPPMWAIGRRPIATDLRAE